MARDFSTGSPGPGVACSTGPERSRASPLLRRHRSCAAFGGIPAATPDPTTPRLQYLGSDRAARSAPIMSRAPDCRSSISRLRAASAGSWRRCWAVAGRLDRATWTPGEPRLFAIISRITDAAQRVLRIQGERERFSNAMPDGESRARRRSGRDCNQRSWNGGGSAPRPDRPASPALLPVSKLRALSPDGELAAFDRAALDMPRPGSSLSPRCRNRRRQDACVRIPFGCLELPPVPAREAR